MSLPWYKEGLRFQCTGCGGCCTKEPGYVWVSKEEVEKIAKFLGISLEDCIKKYTRSVGDKFSLKELSNYDCVFLVSGKRCRIYESRPKQCRTFPFWPEIVESKESWKEAARRCEGIDHQDAPLVPLSRITKHLKEMKE